MTFWLMFIPAMLILILAHTFGMALAGRLVGAWVEEISLFMGPKLFEKSFGTTKLIFRTIPLGGSVKFFGMNPLEDDDSMARSTQPVGTVAFRSLHPLKKMFVPILGLATWSCLAVVGLGVTPAIESTGRGFEQFLQGVWSPSSQGRNYIGLLVQSAQNLGFFQFLGLLAAKNLALNLFPIPILNGGMILLWLVELVVDIPKSFRERTNYVGFAVWMIFALLWMWAIFRYLTT